MSTQNSFFDRSDFCRVIDGVGPDNPALPCFNGRDDFF